MTVSTIKKWVPMAAAPVALLVSGALVWGASNAAFTSKTSNDGNSWAAGTVQLADDDAGSAMFTASGLRPGSTAQRCIAVTSTGSLASSVRLYATAYSQTNGLASHLRFVINEGTGGSFGSCDGFTPGTGGTSGAGTIFDGTAADFAIASSYGTGIQASLLAGTQTSEVRSYRITYTVPSNTPDTAQGGQVNLGFTWEAQNT